MNDNDWPGQFAAEYSYDQAAKCLDDALLVATEREYHGLASLVRTAMQYLKSIGAICDINGQRKLEAQR